MTLAGDDDVLNPVSEGNPTADWLQVMLDLEGLYDLDDVIDGGQAWADMSGIGVYEYDGVAAVAVRMGIRQADGRAVAR